MSEVASEEKVEVKVEIMGETLKLVLPVTEWSFAEADAAADESNGLVPVEIESRLMIGDPNAWRGLLRVSYMRAKRDYPAEEIQNLRLFELIDAFNEQVEKGLEADPTSPSGNGSSAPGELSESEPPKVPDSA